MSHRRQARSSTDRPTAPSPGTQTLERGLALLEILRSAPGGLALADLAAASGLHKSTVHRLVAALSRWGYVSRSPEGRYRLGIRLAELGQVALQCLDLRAEAAPHLRDLVARTGITAHLGVLHGAEIVYLDKVESDRATVRMASTIGGRMPVHSTAIGKAILARLPEDDVRALLARTGLPARTPRTITDMEVLIDQLRLTRRRGWALDDTENEEGIRCVAAPLFDHTGRVVGAVSLSGPVFQVTVEAVPDLARAVQACAARISVALGWSGDGPRVHAPAARTGDGAAR